MFKRWTAAVLGLVFVGSMACVENEPEEEGPQTAQGELNLVTHTAKSSDVEAMRYTITPVPCAKDKYNSKAHGTPIIKEKPLKELTLPGGIGKFEDRPFDADSEHQFSDFLTVVKEGCYDVEVQPLRRKGRLSRDCQAASEQKVHVVDGMTTEIMLISQCRGADMGLLDVVAALNHAPTMVDFEIIPNKFVACPAPGEPVYAKVCARAKDPDGDPLSFDWKQLKGPDAEDLEVVHSVQVDGTKTECVKMRLPVPDDDNGDNDIPRTDAETLGGSGGSDEGHYFKVRVFDQFRDEYGQLIRAEEFYHHSDNYPSKYDDDAIKSRASLEFPIHVSCVEPPRDKPSCPRTASFWKRYNKYAAMPKDIAWPSSHYTKKHAENTRMCGKTWLDQLAIEGDGDAFHTLAHQYIAARLNGANDAQVPLAVGGAMFVAYGILHKCPTLKKPSLIRATAIILAKTLEKYNKGKLTSPKCIDRPEEAFDGDDQTL